MKDKKGKRLQFEGFTLAGQVELETHPEINLLPDDQRPAGVSPPRNQKRKKSLLNAAVKGPYIGCLGHIIRYALLLPLA